jgi:hypothetical protein
MKTYTNGQRKGMMYGGAAKRKPMMYGGMATTKKKKKMQMGGMTQSAPMNQQQKGMQPAMGMPKMMAGGGTAMLGDLDKDGKMSGYEKARQDAINNNMKNKR